MGQENQTQTEHGVLTISQHFEKPPTRRLNFTPIADKLRGLEKKALNLVRERLRKLNGNSPVENLRPGRERLVDPTNPIFNEWDIDIGQSVDMPDPRVFERAEATYVDFRTLPPGTFIEVTGSHPSARYIFVRYGEIGLRVGSVSRPDTEGCFYGPVEGIGVLERQGEKHVYYPGQLATGENVGFPYFAFDDQSRLIDNGQSWYDVVTAINVYTKK